MMRYWIPLSRIYLLTQSKDVILWFQNKMKIVEILDKALFSFNTCKGFPLQPPHETVDLILPQLEAEDQAELFKEVH